MPKFTVIDKKTGEYPDLCKIALEKDWAKNLMYCDMEGFAIEEDGTLVLMDECGRYAYPPENRFEIRLVDETSNDELNEEWVGKIYSIVKESEE